MFYDRKKRVSEMKKVLLITPIYPCKSNVKGTTPVVHYFAKEWVNMGCEVTVVHIDFMYPKFVYWIGKRFGGFLISKIGSPVPNHAPDEYDEVLDGVTVHHFSIPKLIPHSRVNKSKLRKALKRIEHYFHAFEPDVVIGHWDNPQLEILSVLKQKYKVPTYIVLHTYTGHEFELKKLYGADWEPMISSLNGIGFRNKPAKLSFEKEYGSLNNAFYAYSGVSESFVKQPVIERNYETANRLIFTGSLIKRKYPKSLIEASIIAYSNSDFHITYVGEGHEKKAILDEYSHTHNDKLSFTGRIPREDIVSYLDQSDIFVMISQNEVFGLVYLEAMARGCIAIGSIGEGIDGIIVDGVNGFLCEAGNTQELASVLSRINEMTPEQRRLIAENGMKTARHFTDEKVARRYLEDVEKLM